MHDPDRLWCPEWYPASLSETPCDAFFEHGIYVADTNSRMDVLINQFEDSEERICTDHERRAEVIPESEWETRLASARLLAVERKWVVPEPIEWDDGNVEGETISRDGPTCVAGSSIYRCDESVNTRIVTLADGTVRTKRVCPSIGRYASKPPTERDFRDIAQTSHVKIYVPYLPPNY
jgi:hypothetical protein